MPDASFACPDLTTFARVDEVGLVVTGQRREPDRAVLACRVVEADDWCHRCGEPGRARDTVVRVRTAFEQLASRRPLNGPDHRRIDVTERPQHFFVTRPIVVTKPAPIPASGDVGRHWAPADEWRQRRIVVPPSQWSIGRGRRRRGKRAIGRVLRAGVLVLIAQGCVRPGLPSPMLGAGDGK